MQLDNINESLLPQSLPDLDVSIPSLPNNDLEDFSAITPALINADIAPSTLTLVDLIRKDNPLNPNDTLSSFEKKLLKGNDGPSTSDYFNTNRGINLSGIDIDSSLVRKELSDGTSIARFKSFTPFIDNEDSLALKQGFLEQTFNGVGKFVGKTALNVIDGTIGTAAGLVNGISEGSMSAIYNNDFSKFIDDLNVRMDLQLPNYYTQEQKNMNFLRSTLTTNFWANDVLGGLSFMVGAIGSEAIWAGLTGGSSLISAPARIAAKAGARGLLKAAGKQTGKNFHKDTLKVFKSHLRKASNSGPGKALNNLRNTYNGTIPAGKIGQVASNLRFLYTSAGFEAGVEARHSLNSSLENFTAAHEKVNGRKPTAAEYSIFMEDAVDSANKVFAGNVALVGASNIAQFGAIFGVGTGLSKNLTRSIGKRFGVGVTKSNAAGKIIYAPLKSTKLKKGVGNTLSYLKAPVIEGFVEEGGQSVISKTSEKWLAAKFNPDALQKNYGVIQAASQGFKDTYGTKEGFKEVGLGMIIGALGGRGTRLASGQSFLGNDFQDNANRTTQLATGLNSVSSQLDDAQRALLDRLVTTNQFNTFITKSQQNAEEGNMFQASLDFDAAQFSKMLLEEEAGMLEESEKDFAKVIRDTPITSLTEQFGINAEQAQQYKTALVNNFNSNTKLFSQSMDVAKSLSLVDFNIKGVAKDYTRELGLNIFLGVKSGQRARDIADSIDELIGTTGVGSAMNLYSNLSNNAKQRVEELTTLQEEVASLESQLATLIQSFNSTSLNVTERQADNESVAKAIDQREAAKQEIQEEIQKKRAEVDAVSSKLDDRFYKSNFAFGGRFNIFNDNDTDGGFVTDSDLAATVEELKKLERFKELLREENPNVANQLENLIQEYGKNVKAFRDFNLVFEQMADPRFAKNSYKGITRLFNNIGTDFNSEALQSSPLDTETEALKNFLETNKDTLDESDVFTVKVLHRLSTSFSINTDPLAGPVEVVETISQDEYDSFVNSGIVSEETLDRIAAKDAAGRELSEREEEIKSAYNKEIEDRVTAIKENVGDRLSAVVENNETPANTETRFDENTLLGQLKNLVQKIKNSKSFLQDFDIAGINSKQKPTNKDYKRYDELIRDKQKGRLTPKKIEELEELTEKINNWGRLEGTTLPEGTRLSSLIEQIILLEGGSTTSEVASMPVTDLNDLMEGVKFEPTKGNQNYNVLQSYDKAMVSINEYDEYLIANINISGVLNIIAENLNFTLKRNNKKVDLPSTGWDFKNVTEKDRFTIFFDNNGKKERIVFSINGRGNVVLSKSSRNKINSFTNLVIGKNSEVSKNYQPLLRRVQTAEGEIKTTVPSNFRFADNSQMATDPIFDLKIGDRLDLEVSTKDPFNKQLIDDYNKANTPKRKEAALKRLRSELVIYARDSKGDLVGVHKNTKNVITKASDPNFNRLRRIRETALTRVFDADITQEQSVNVGMSVPVSFVYLGHPNFNISVTEDGTSNVQTQEFTDDVLPKVLDIGYAENGVTRLKKKTEGVNISAYMKRVLTDQKYQNRKVPFIVFDFRGNKIAYPVSLKTVANNSTEKLESILSSGYNANDEILKINELILSSGLDIDKLGVTVNTYTPEAVETIRQALGSNESFSDVSKWMDSRTIPETLKAEGAINIDLDNPFHSPKIRTDLGGVDGLDVSTSYSTIVREEVTPEIKEEVDDMQNKDCKSA